MLVVGHVQHSKAGQNTASCHSPYVASSFPTSGWDPPWKMVMDEKLAMTRQCALAAQKASRALGCIPSGMGSRARGGFCPSVLF